MVKQEEGADVKLQLAKLLEGPTGIKQAEILGLLEIPPEYALGDYSFPCFSLSKILRKAPARIATDVAQSLKRPENISEIKVVGPYINFFVDKNWLAKKVLSQILAEEKDYGAGKRNDEKKREKIMIEYPAPNTNKPLHLGHVRNMLLGNSVCNLLKFSGYDVIPVDLVNDRGIHICKSMLAYQKWGNNLEPDKKSDHFVGDFYVMYSKKEKEHPALEGETQEMLRKWESHDKELIELWKKMRKWSLDGFEQTYRLFDVKHRKTYYESEIYTHGKEIILRGLKDGVFEKDEDGAVIADLENDGLGKKVLLREDGTSIYITQDLYLAKKKFEDFKMDRSIYVVGNEQNFHFRVLFKLLEKLEMPFAKKCHHLSYGMISLPEGRMKSREGTVVDADDMYKEMASYAREEIKKRHPEIKENELEKRSKVIGIGALKFFILKYDPAKDFTYNPVESVSFEGETGPYVQYAHARICSILRQVQDFDTKEHVFSKNTHKLEYTNEKEFTMITLLADFPTIVKDSAEQYKPSLVARYLLELAQAFNEFYQECPVLKAEDNIRESRLHLIYCTNVVLRNALSLLGIDAPEEM